MLYPNSPRLSVADAVIFFERTLRPMRLPAVAMGAHSEPCPLDRDLSESDLARVDRGITRTILISLSP